MGTNLSLRVDDDAAHRLDALTRRHDRSKSDELRAALEVWYALARLATAPFGEADDATEVLGRAVWEALPSPARHLVANGMGFSAGATEDERLDFELGLRHPPMREVAQWLVTRPR